MAKGQGGKDSKQQFDTINSVGSEDRSRATNLYNTLFPAYKAEYDNPQGYGDAAIAGMNTAVGQATGGAAARARGEARLAETRTGNTGAYTPGADEASRESTREAANAALSIQNENARLKERQKQEGLAGMGGLYGTNVNALDATLNAGNSAVHNEIQADQNNWFNNMLRFMQVGAEGAATGAKIA